MADDGIDREDTDATDRDRLAADLTATDTLRVSEQADRLIALGWTRLDEERLARALALMSGAHPKATGVQRRDVGDYRLGLNVPYVIPTVGDFAAAIAKTYREDTDATD